ncbi:MAG TPA: M1 family aminopeptidase, partial [Lacipirellulaceae bacterium]|nr:M1 family aminopeptidase [Lacipirellulaceae bacterium]
MRRPPLCRLLLVAALVPLAVGDGAVAREHAERCRYCRAARDAAAKGAEGPPTRHYAPDRQVDLTHIKLEATPDFQRRSLAGVATLRFAPIAKPLTTLQLDGVNLRVSAVSASHEVRTWSAGSEQVTIVFARPIEPDAPAWVEIVYEAEPVEGLYFRTAAMGLPPSDEHCWTQGETHEARHWFPSFDYPNERASSELVCHVPPEMTVVSNGRLVSDSLAENGARRTFHWLQEKPHVSYLICFVAGRLEKLSGQHGKTPLGFYAQPSKSAHAASAFEGTAEIMAFLEAEIGVPYPWEKYDQATISDFMWGGMENTTITTLTQRTLFENAADDYHAARARSLNAHEMAHQWFGDYETCKDWSHLWLNEGFATYYALLYEGRRSGREALLYGLYLDARDEIFLPENAADVRPIVYREYERAGDQFDYRNYPKASWVLHMLRSRVGDELFRQGIHTYLQRHALGEVETDDLREVFEELTDEPLDRFFDQWLYHGGRPRLTVTYEWLAAERLAHVTISQTQSRSEDVLLFEAPTKVRFVVDGERHDEEVVLKDRRHELFVRLPAEPQVVRFDPAYTLLAEVTFEKPARLLENDLKDPADVVGRLLACEGLARHRTGRSIAALKQALQGDAFYGVRESAARALRELGSEEAVAALVDSGDQPDVRVRRAVAEQLGLCFHDAAQGRLLEIIADERELPVVAGAAIAALGRFSGGEAEAPLRAALASRSLNNERLIGAFEAIGESRQPRWAPELMRVIADREADTDSSDLALGMRTLAAVAQRGRRQSEAFAFLAGYLDHPREPLR